MRDQSPEVLCTTLDFSTPDVERFLQALHHQCSRFAPIAHVLLHIGTNDFVKNDDPTQAPARLSHLLNLITTTLLGATVIVAQILPLPRSARLNAEVVAYNAAIPGIVQADVAQGKHVHYADMYHAVPASILVDQIHPNDTGYALMAKVWLYALLLLLRRSNLS